MSGKKDKKLYKDAQEAWEDTDQNLITRLEETMFLAHQLSRVRLIRFLCWWLERIAEAPVPYGLVDEIFDYLVYITLRRIRSEVLMRIIEDHHLEEDEANRLIELEGAFVAHLGEITRWLNPHHDS